MRSATGQPPRENQTGKSPPNLGRFTELTAVRISNFRFGSGPGIRTLNLAVNRSLHSVQKPRSEFAECRQVPPFAMVYRRRCCTDSSSWPRCRASLG